jgi:molybdopterin molybdotransferase
MIEVREAVRILSEAVEPLGSVEVPLERASGRILAGRIDADRDFPPTDRSAMDGYAVRSADLDGPDSRLLIAGEIRAGEPAGDIVVESGQAVRVFTGSVIPPGADAVVMVERTMEDLDAGTVAIEGAARRGEHIRPRGSEMKRGGTVLEPGTLVQAPEIAALAAVGRSRLAVSRLPQVNVVSTGDELVEPDCVPLDHQVRNSNGYTLRAQLSELGLEANYLGIAPDTAPGLSELLSRALSADLLLLTGGVSVGNYDLVGDALADAGMDRLFYKVAVKPGKPLLAGRCGSCLVLGLPGNPVSAYTAFAVFVAPVLRRMMGARVWMNQEITARLEKRLCCRQARTTYRLARLEPEGPGFVARLTRSTGSGDLLSMSRANGFVITPAGSGELEQGTELQAMLWRDFHLRV